MGSKIKQDYTQSFFKPKREYPKRSPNGFPVGPRTIKRQEQNRILNERLPEIKKRCEIRISSYCTGTSRLSWAHSKKSRFLLTDKDWQEAARCCLPCHDKIEVMSHADMKRIVLEAINKRPKNS